MAESVRESITLPAAPDDVWDVLMDPNRLEEWVTAHRKLGRLPELPLGVGDGFRQRLGIGPIGFWVEWELLDLDKPHMARWRGAGPGNSAATVIYRLSEDGDGPRSTRFEYENDFQPPATMLGAAAKRVINATAGRREARRSMKRLREVF